MSTVIVIVELVPPHRNSLHVIVVNIIYILMCSDDCVSVIRKCNIATLVNAGDFLFTLYYDVQLVVFKEYSKHDFESFSAILNNT